MSMICPKSYIELHSNDSFEQLIAEKNGLQNRISELEKIIFAEDRADPMWSMSPGPDVLYQVSLEYLAEICRFIKEKYNSEIVWG